MQTFVSTTQDSPNDFFFYLILGGILAAGVTYGSFKMSSTWAWRLPSALQGVFSVFSLLFLPLVPESPRWLVHKGRNSEALAVLALTYADGDAEDPVVLTVYKEIIDTLTFEKEREKEISYMAVLRHKPTLKRLSLMLSVAIITMVSGMFR